MFYLAILIFTAFITCACCT